MLSDKPWCLTRLPLSGLFDCGKQVRVTVSLQTKFSHPLTSLWTPGSLSQQSLVRLPASTLAEQWVWSSNAKRSCTYVKELMHQPGWSFDCFSVFLFLLSSLLQLSFPPSPLSPPDLSSLPSCPLTASCCSSYHSRKRDTLSAQSNQHQTRARTHTHHTHTFSVAIAALKGGFLTPILLPQVPAEVAGGTSPTWAKSVNGLIHYGHECLYFTTCRNNKAGVAERVFIYVFIYLRGSRGCSGTLSTHSPLKGFPLSWGNRELWFTL